MTATLLPELTRASAEAMRHVVSERVAAPPGPADGRDAVYGALSVFESVERSYRNLLAAVDEGGESRELLRLAETTERAVIAWLRLAEQGRVLAGVVEAAYGRPAEGLAELAEAVARAEASLAEVRSLGRWLASPSPPADLKRLEETRARMAAGEVVDSAGVVERLERDALDVSTTTAPATGTVSADACSGRGAGAAWQRVWVRWPRYEAAAPAVLAAGLLGAVACGWLALAPLWVGFVVCYFTAAALAALAFTASP
jgi:hypothetical protein